MPAGGRIDGGRPVLGRGCSMIITSGEKIGIVRATNVRSQKQFGYGLMGKLNGSVVNFQRSLGLTGVVAVGKVYE